MKKQDPRAAMANIMNNSAQGKRVTVAVSRPGTGAAMASGTGIQTTGTRSTAVLPPSEDRIEGELGATLNDLWEASHPHATSIPVAAMRTFGSNPPSRTNEQGCWILYNRQTGRLRPENFAVPSNDRDGCSPGTPNLQAHERVAAFFHTHPNSNDEGYNAGPSPADQSFAQQTGYPGLIRTRNGYRWFGPPVA